MTTRWSVLLAVRDADPEASREALAALCKAYWYPLYAFVRRKGYDAETAQDRVQGYFSMLLERGELARLDRGRGRFRSFLMASCSNYLANQADRDRAVKRGGGLIPISINCLDAEGRYADEPSHGLTAERLFERRWAISLLDHALTRLEAEMEHHGKSVQFEALRPSLLGTGERFPYAQIAGSLDVSEEAARAAAYRLRRRYRELLREEVAATIGELVDVDDEIRELFSALSE